MSFQDAFDTVVGEEGGYVNNPNDPGGETKYGISHRAYPDEDIANLTLERAQFLYKRDYWDALGLDDRLPGYALVLFDCAVNNGVNAARVLLTQVGSNSASFIVSFQAERALRYASLPTFATFGRGWMRRLIRVAIDASKL